MLTKFCCAPPLGCGLRKPVSEFHRNTRRGFQSICKACDLASKLTDAYRTRKNELRIGHRRNMSPEAHERRLTQSREYNRQYAATPEGRALKRERSRRARAKEANPEGRAKRMDLYNAWVSTPEGRAKRLASQARYRARRKAKKAGLL